MKLSSLDLNLLLVFHAVSAEKSVVAAARALHVTPSAVSNALARLRAALSDPLFVRSGRGLVPTPRALRLAPVVAQALHELGCALGGDAAFEPERTTRAFTIALADSDQVASLPALAAAFGRALPRAQLHAVSIDALIAGGGLASPTADVAIGPRLEEPDLHMQPLYEAEAVLLVRRDHPRVRAGARVLSRELFNSLRHVDTHLALGRPGVGHRAATDMFARFGLSREVAITVPSFSAAAMIAAKTELVAAVPRRVGETLTGLLPLRCLALPLPAGVKAPRMALYMLWHERTQRDAGARFFRTLVEQSMGTSGPRR